MTPRNRRLLSDLRAMEEIAARGVLTFRTSGDPPERYEVLLQVPGLARTADGALTTRGLHRFEAYLHRDYPRRPPVVTWSTPVFHPNLLGADRNGGVCVGGWSASESLADLCVRLRDLVSWKAFNASDALDAEAGAWATTHEVLPGSDVRELALRGLDAPVVTFTPRDGGTALHGQST